MTPVTLGLPSPLARRAPALLVAALALALGACEMGCATGGGVVGDGVSTAGPYEGADGADPQRRALLDATDQAFSPARTLGYGPARDALYAREDRRGGVCSLYTGWCARLGPGDPSIAADAVGINAEHVWPQSRGAREEPLKSDLHHLFPERANVNSSRSNLPFGEVPDADSDAWYRLDASQSRTPREHLDEWSERGLGLWEPREARKGDVARAVFYVAAVYPEAVDPAFFPPMRETLLRWNRADPPDADERDRSAWVASLQGTENPFVLDPALADRIWGTGPLVGPGGGTVRGGEGTRGPGPSTPPVGDPPPLGAGVPGPQTGLLTISEVHYDNAGDDVGEGVEVSGPDGAPLDGWALVFVNGNGGDAYRTVPLSGAVVGGARWVPVENVQNGAPDGVALVDPSGRTVEAVAWEGSFAGADGTVFRDLGVSEDGDTPAGTSLQRVRGRWVAGRPATPGRPND